ncbi:hypothetical protein [Agrobacterium tumefaciens]|uniref:hypothetical protein n=1 Tax=Agrobacterium tumefaciens TaxID=358 RepID=UPI001571ACAA|nr:hypothetical protein [Agrobacterium tumefaciens]WCJ62790.1 hypothetical protein G6M15_00890 [Agrobacterium tumefaciens]
MDQFWVVWEWAKSVLALASVLGISVTAVVGAAYALFKFFGEKWLTQKFAERLEAYKAEQTRELERLRYKINAVFDRTKRLHDREFDVVPDLWGKLVEAHGWAWSYISPLQSYPDIDRMDQEELDEFLEGKPFSKAQKRDISVATKRLETYKDISERYKYADAMDKIRDFNIAYRKQGIFLQPEIKKDMNDLFQMIRGAVIEHQINQEDKPRPRLRDGYKKLDSEGKVLFEKIEQGIVDRLWESTTTEL